MQREKSTSRVAQHNKHALRTDSRVGHVHNSKTHHIKSTEDSSLSISHLRHLFFFGCRCFLYHYINVGLHVYLAYHQLNTSPRVYVHVSFAYSHMEDDRTRECQHGQKLKSPEPARSFFSLVNNELTHTPAHSATSPSPSSKLCSPFFSRFRSNWVLLCSFMRFQIFTQNAEVAHLPYKRKETERGRN